MADEPIPITPPISPATQAKVNDAVVSAASPVFLKPLDAQVFVAGFIMTAFVTVLGLLCFHVVPTENQSALLVLLGILGTQTANICQYYFGSTSTSKKKDDTISSLATNAAPAPPA